MKRNINKHGKKLIILMALMILTLSFAIFSDNKVNELEGGLHTFGINVELTGADVDGKLELADLLLPGDEVDLGFNVSVPLDFDGVAAADARVRHRVELTTDNAELLTSGRLTLIVDGKTINPGSDTATDSYVVEVGKNKDVDVKIIVNKATLNGAQAATFSADIITEAIQAKNTTDADFTNASVVKIVSINGNDVVAKRNQ